MTIRIEPIQASPEADGALEALLHQSYIDGGFTDPELADMLRSTAVRSRGTVLVARDPVGTIVGTVTIVGADSPARRLATAHEVELHLLCVRPGMRGNGIGASLVQKALMLAKASRARGIVLWTQPTMDAAQRVYTKCGFHRDPNADFRHGRRQFLVYRCSLAAEPAADAMSSE
jgi:GNAT superfamily N-acetyltransferase